MLEEKINTREARDSRTRSEPLPEVAEMTNQQLSITRKKGSSGEKLKRVWNAITTYNDNTPEYKINPTNKILREISGGNGTMITEWLQQHKTMVDAHIHKHDFDTYYNNKYRNHKQKITT